NIFDGNQGYGLDAQSGGAITSGGLEANDNYSYGARLDNSGASSAMAVTLTGTSSFSGNSHSDGLDIESTGAITVNNVSADDNGGTGGDLDNEYGFMEPIKITGTNWFDDNGGGGLTVHSYGAITLNNIDASGNSYGGLYADNSLTTLNSTPEAITLTGNNTFSNDVGGYGASLNSKGAVTVNNVTADSDLSFGVLITNDALGSLHPQSVSLLGTNNLSSNGFDNLATETYGAITINNLTANGSLGGSGADLYFLGLTQDVTGAVTLTGTNSFDSNGGTGPGLNIDSKGAITLNNISADGNRGTGVQLYNNNGFVAAIKVTGTNWFDGNGGGGLNIHSYGAITLNNINASGNIYGDLFADNSSTTLNSTPEAITLTGNNTFSNSTGGYGASFDSKGAITLNNVTDESNGAYGLIIENDALGSSHPQSVSLLGTNTFLKNGADGVSIVSDGAVSLTHITANFNYFDGLLVQTPGKVTVTCGSFIGNGTGHNAGEDYGINETATPSSTTLIGVDSAGNYSGSLQNWLAGTVTTSPTCTLP
ncbi:MAG: hypothetical protein WBW94_14805, partial [Anaerolineales bacterium]